MLTINRKGEVIDTINSEQVNVTISEKYEKPYVVFTTDSSFVESESTVKKCCKKLNVYAEEDLGYVIVGEANTQTWKRTITTLKNKLKNVKIVEEVK